MVTVERDEENKVEDDGQLSGERYEQLTLQLARTQYRALSEYIPDNKDMFGRKSQTTSVAHVMGIASSFGGLPYRLGVAQFKRLKEPNNNGEKEWKIHINETIPVGSSGFWSVHVYKKRSGKLCPNAKKFNINSYNHKPNVDGSITISFTNNAAYKNVINICNGWTYTVRFYEPMRKILDEGWTLPQPEPLTPDDAF